MAKAGLRLEWLENRFAPAHVGIGSHSHVMPATFVPEGIAIVGHSSFFHSLPRSSPTAAAEQSGVTETIRWCAGVAPIDPTMQPMQPSDASIHMYPADVVSADPYSDRPR
jgi:hypothetical protein